MTINALRHQVFASLSVRNYRLYFIGQGLSHCGNWMQTVALGWLVLQLTGSGVALGSMLAIKYLPMLIGAPFVGLIVDRFDKRHILYVTQAVLALLALALSFLVFAELAQLWMIYLLAFGAGLADLFDNPTRQIYVHEMVGRDRLRNAVSLNSTLANLARALGPLLAGTLIAVVGIAACFFVNALSFVAVLVMLTMIRQSELHREPESEKKAWHLLAGVRYAASVPLIRNILIAMAVIGTLSYEFQVSLPLLAQNTFFGNAADYAALLSAMGAGSVAGGLFAASRHEVSAREFVVSTFLFGVSICITALMPSLGLATVGMIFVGFFSITMASAGNTMVQLESEPSMRGSVMALWSMAIFGSTLIGAPVIGLIGEYVGAQWALATSGIAALLVAWFAASAMFPRNLLLQYIPAFIRIRSEEKTIEDTKV